MAELMELKIEHAGEAKRKIRELLTERVEPIVRRYLPEQLEQFDCVVNPRRAGVWGQPRNETSQSALESAWQYRDKAVRHLQSLKATLELDNRTKQRESADAGKPSPGDLTARKASRAPFPRSWRPVKNLREYRPLKEDVLKAFRDVSLPGPTGGRCVEESVPMLRVFERIDLLNRQPNDPILVLGEIGAGKSAIAKLIHERSDRRGASFHEEQVSDSLHSDFALTKGRWVGYGTGTKIGTGPDRASTGLLQDHRGGTIFIDEIHRTSEPFQVFLNQVLDRRPIPLTAGKGESVVPDVRMIFAMNITIEEAVALGRLQEDFLSRIRGQSITVPPLVERLDDIPLYVRHQFRGMEAKSIDRGVLLALFLHTWPSNVRELFGVLRKIQMLPGDRPFGIDHLDPTDLPTVEVVSALDEDAIRRKLFQVLRDLLQTHGFGIRTGLHSRMAEVLGVDEGSVTKMAKLAGT